MTLLAKKCLKYKSSRFYVSINPQNYDVDKATMKINGKDDVVLSFCKYEKDHGDCKVAEPSCSRSTHYYTGSIHGCCHVLLTQECCTQSTSATSAVQLPDRVN